MGVVPVAVVLIPVELCSSGTLNGETLCISFGISVWEASKSTIYVAVTLGVKLVCSRP